MAGARERGAAFWPLAVTRELDDLILWLRTNETELGTWLIKTSGDAGAVLGYERLLAGAAGPDWLADEIRHFAKRTLRRLDVTSRSLFALIEPGSCFAGPLLELALACDRQFMLNGLPDERSGPGGRPGSAAARRAHPVRGELRRVPHVQRPDQAGIPVPRRPGSRGQAGTAHRAPGRGRRKPWTSGWSRSPRTTWTGTTRYASPARSGPRSAPTR